MGEGSRIMKEKPQNDQKYTVRCVYGHSRQPEQVMQHDLASKANKKKKKVEFLVQT